jgi:CubicO group peptidase (beta-lactamase class C family)
MNALKLSKRVRDFVWRYRLPWIAAVVVLLVAVALPDAGKGVVIMAPFTSDNLGLRGVVPQGWIEVESGVFARGTSATDRTALILQSAPGVAVEELAAAAAAQLGFERLPERAGIYSGSSLTWDLYSFDAQIEDLGSETSRVNLALATHDSVTYAVALIASPQDYAAQAPLFETVFSHVLYALAPVERSVADESRAAPAEVSDVQLVPFTSQHFALRGVVPEGWAEVAPGVFADVTSSAALQMMSYPGVTMDQAVAALPLILGIEELPDSPTSFESETFTWDLYTVETELPGDEARVLHLALAEDDSTFHIVLLQTAKDNAEAHHAGVFLPAIESLEPMPLDRRDKLSFSELMAADLDDDSPVYNAYFEPMEESSAALHEPEGILTVPEFEMRFKNSDNELVRPSQAYFPGFSVAVFTYQDYLVPAIREIVPSTGEWSYWSIILSPGKVWSEPGDEGMSRASFPFVLVGPDYNEAHNGLATFVYNDTRISSFRFQVIQETAAWNQTDFWGQSPIAYDPGRIENRDVLAAQFAEELRRQTPVRPWSDLEEDYDPRLLTIFSSVTAPLNISATGLIMDGTLYLQPCFTRYGVFPYCRTMRHGVFSVTKSMGAAVAMLRLAERYGEDVFDLKIVDYVKVIANHDGWQDVTFGDALNMATGVGDYLAPDKFTGDEDEPRFSDFLTAKSAQDKLAVCFSYNDYPWGPGEVARYNSINTFVLSAAMNEFLQNQEGPDADIWDMVVEEVYNPIGIQHAPIMRTHESDGSKGLPIFGYGLYPTVDDVAKVADLYHSGGRHQGRQLLHAGKLAEALYKVDGVGLPTGEGNAYGDALYHMSFWSMPYRAENGAVYQIPYMTGFGGNHVALMPNGMTGFRFADAFAYGIESMVRVADGIDPFAAP